MNTLEHTTLMNIKSLLPNAIIVTRHQGAIQWLAEHFGGRLDGDRLIIGDVRVPIVPSATPDDVRGVVVIGNVPLSIAAEARLVIAIEFQGEPPRGAEYTAEDMKAAGATLRPYVAGRCTYAAPGGKVKNLVEAYADAGHPAYRRARQLIGWLATLPEAATANIRSAWLWGYIEILGPDCNQHGRGYETTRLSPDGAMAGTTCFECGDDLKPIPADEFIRRLVSEVEDNLEDSIESRQDVIATLERVMQAVHGAMAR